jgi:putative ribosome biogenesis GTPase RsgA
MPAEGVTALQAFAAPQIHALKGSSGVKYTLINMKIEQLLFISLGL